MTEELRKALTDIRKLAHDAITETEKANRNKQILTYNEDGTPTLEFIRGCMIWTRMGSDYGPDEMGRCVTEVMMLSPQELVAWAKEADMWPEGV